MTIRTRLASVLRARKAQEDIARGAVTRANARLADTVAEAAARHDSMEGWAVPRGGDAASYMAAIAAGRALATALSEARALERVARAETDVEVENLREAAKRRRSVEKLVERTIEAQRVKELADAQRAADEVAGQRAAGGRGETR
ncbi:flagellar FliJ family protein [Actinokineospora auranticolor]|uniref:Flagellar FliJ protein n=1 Tax=Actinokineospora auranticolor TaxID=155976 RepID=A0A2S6GMX3_9PSEU|nr:flagellar FliJ family protein [Actinokineospora auranticolor]PPK66481.1 flagellar export protein FliJ [Actinokineospora auranticolor]